MLSRRIQLYMLCRLLLRVKFIMKAFHMLSMSSNQESYRTIDSYLSTYYIMNLDHIIFLSQPYDLSTYPYSCLPKNKKTWCCQLETITTPFMFPYGGVDRYANSTHAGIGSSDDKLSAS